MNFFLSAILVVGGSVAAAAQAPCPVSLEELPDIHGIRIGTVRAEFEMVNISGEVGVRLPGTSKPADLANIENIWLGFHNDRLTAVEFDYDKATEWKNIREFAAVLESKLKLPLAAWVFIDTTEAKIECLGFRVAISAVRNTLSITDTAPTDDDIAKLRRTPFNPH